VLTRGPANGLPLTRPRAFRFPQRDATRRAETRRVAPGQRTARGRVLRPSWAALPVGFAQATDGCATHLQRRDTRLVVMCAGDLQGELLATMGAVPNAISAMIGRATLWQKRRASGRLRRSRLRCSCDAAKAQRVQFELLLPCVPGDATRRRLTLVSALRGTLNAPGGSRAKMYSTA
jgi:hypothetical protein